MEIRICLIAIICSMCWTANAQIESKDNKVGYTLSIPSKIMGDERTIQVFLPDGYEDSDKAYPVLYVLDGQHYFLHAVSLQQSFVEFKQTPGFIIVGISKHPADRNRNFSVHADKYLEFLKTEVIHHIDQTYRTTPKRMLFGWAYGGDFAVETMITEADLFEWYIAASPFPLKGKINKLDSLLAANPNFDRGLYFSSGTDEGMVKEGTHELNALLQHNALKTMNWTFRELAGEEHQSTPFTTLYHGIKGYFNYFPELQFSNLEAFTAAGGLDHVYDYYQKRAAKFGFSSELSDWIMFSITRNASRANDYQQFEALVNEFKPTGFLDRIRLSRSCLIADFYFDNQQYDQAIELFSLIAVKHPDAARPLNGLGKAYEALKETAKASEYFEKAKALSGTGVN